jgi:hypothetical protein
MKCLPAVGNESSMVRAVMDYGSIETAIKKWSEATPFKIKRQFLDNSACLPRRHI